MLGYLVTDTAHIVLHAGLVDAFVIQITDVNHQDCYQQQYGRQYCRGDHELNDRKAFLAQRLWSIHGLYTRYTMLTVSFPCPLTSGQVTLTLKFWVALS